MTSASNELDDETMLCCASCGTAQVDDIKLKKCTACDLVQYCSDKCQREHRPKHDATCNERAAELRDEILFKQPESRHLGDCPICLLPMPIDLSKSSSYSCCSKLICDGCDLANQIRELKDRLQHKCPFCRHPAPKSRREADMNRMKRVKKNDPVAIRELASKHIDEVDDDTAFEYYTKAAELGDAIAHYNLSVAYRNGEGGVEKDEEKGLHHLEEAAIAGHPDARFYLACYEWRNGRYERAVKHWIIAANLGCDDSIKALKLCYVHGNVSKEDFAAALRGHQAAIDATKSPQREAADRKKEVGKLPK